MRGGECNVARSSVHCRSEFIRIALYSLVSWRAIFHRRLRPDSIAPANREVQREISYDVYPPTVKTIDLT